MELHKCFHPECNELTGNLKYCSRSCSAKINNSTTPKRTAKVDGPCEMCGKLILYKKQKRGGYSPRRFCEKCYPEARAKISSGLYGSIPIEDTTLGDLKKRRSSYWSWRVEITSHARKVYMRSDKPKECILCGYTKHFDVCHKDDVSTCSDTTTVKELNRLENLIALCKNHHWEFDHNLLDKKDKLKLQ
jgi:hypothetical protein